MEAAKHNFLLKLLQEKRKEAAKRNKKIRKQKLLKK
jgi:hypothetical protein